MTEKTIPFPPRSTTSATPAVPQVYADGLARVSFVRGSVRLDFAQLSATRRDPDGSPSLEQNIRVVTSLEGFLATYRSMQQMVHRLAAEGKIATVDTHQAAMPQLNPDAARSQSSDR